MLRPACLAAFSLILVLFVHGGLRAEEDDQKALQGSWTAESMVINGMRAPLDVIKRMKFTFRDGKLFVQGNFENGREDECVYTLDSKASPKQLDFTPPMEKKPVLGIYELNGDTWKLCLRHAGSDKGRPTELASKLDSECVLLVLKRQKP